MKFDFLMPVKIVSGAENFQNAIEDIQKMGSRCLIITGKCSAKKSGAFADATLLLEKAGVDYDLFDEISENPTLQSCREAGKKAIDFSADFLYGIGGGSAMDATRAAAIFVSNPDISDEDLFANKWNNNPVKFILTGTTAGTGSEVTPNTVLTQQNGRKRAVSHPDLYAALALVDHKYVASMSKDTAMSTALDALSHTLEGYLNPSCTDISAHFAEKAISMIWENLIAIDDGDYQEDEILSELYYGSLWAGFILNAQGTAFPHPLGYILTEDFDIPHGRACATFLPALIKNAYSVKDESPQTAIKLVLLQAITGCSVEQICEKITNFANTSHIRMTAQQVRQYSQRWNGLKNFDRVPNKYTLQQAIDLFNELFVS